MPSSQPSLSASPARITMSDIQDLVDQVDDTVEVIRETAFSPTDAKTAPQFGTAQVAEFCGLSHDAMLRRLEKVEGEELTLPAGTIAQISSVNGTQSRKRRVFTLKETLEWVAGSAQAFVRPANVPGCVLSVANFKGGVGKTTITMSLAQGLSLKGYRVLCIDFDPQGSLTTLFGIDPTSVRVEQTFLPLAAAPDREGSRSTLRESVRETYWQNVDLVAGSTELFNGEFWLPSRQMRAVHRDNDEKTFRIEDGVQIRKDPNTFRFYDVLSEGLKGLSLEYDYIIIDTPPALSYMTMNAFWASDAILMPLPPEGLDFASSAQFWSMFTELAAGSGASVEKQKTFAWIGIVPSKVDGANAKMKGAKIHTKTFLKAMQRAYGQYLTTAQIPLSDAPKQTSMKLQTVYDIAKFTGSNKTFARVRQAFDELVLEVDHLTRQKLWGQL